MDTNWPNYDTVIVTCGVQDKRLIVGSVFPYCAIQKYRPTLGYGNVHVWIKAKTCVLSISRLHKRKERVVKPHAFYGMQTPRAAVCYYPSGDG